MTYGPYHAVVDRVQDGDTIYCKLDLGFDLTVYARCRIYGINAPELSTQAGKDAKAYAETLLPIGSSVTVISHGWDKYGGRVDADIYYGQHSTSFASEMLSTGHAVPFTA